MVERGFSETELRLLLEDAHTLHRDTEPGRWAVLSRRGAADWKIIVEPDAWACVLVVVTAWRLD
jgi:hypothetical protein